MTIPNNMSSYTYCSTSNRRHATATSNCSNFYSTQPINIAFVPGSAVGSLSTGDIGGGQSSLLPTNSLLGIDRCPNYRSPAKYQSTVCIRLGDRRNFRRLAHSLCRVLHCRVRFTLHFAFMIMHA